MTALEHVCLISVHIKSKSSQEPPLPSLLGTKRDPGPGISPVFCFKVALKLPSPSCCSRRENGRVLKDGLTFWQLLYVSYNVSALYLEIKISILAYEALCGFFPKLRGVSEEVIRRKMPCSQG